MSPTVMTNSGFNTSASTLAAFVGVETLKAIPDNGALILFDPKDPLGEISARVVRRYLRTGTVLAAQPGMLPDGVDVAVIVGPVFEQGPESVASECL